MRKMSDVTKFVIFLVIVVCVRIVGEVVVRDDFARHNKDSVTTARGGIATWPDRQSRLVQYRYYLNWDGKGTEAVAVEDRRPFLPYMGLSPFTPVHYLAISNGVTRMCQMRLRFTRRSGIECKPTTLSLEERHFFREGEERLRGI